MVTELVAEDLAEPTELFFCKVLPTQSTNIALKDALDKAWIRSTGHPIWLQKAGAQQPLGGGKSIPVSWTR
jgi:hypothetical protein